MFEIGEYIIYNNNGVCKVIDISASPYSKDKSNLYYTLQPVFDIKSKILIPVDSDKVFMRKIHTREEVQTIIESMVNIEPFWIEDRKQRELKLKETFKSHDSYSCMKMLKGLYVEKKNKNAEGKKLSNADNLIFTAAEKLLFEEFAVALDIPLESVSEYIEAHQTENK